MTPEANACRLLIREALDHYQLPDTENAVRLLCMIAAHESDGFTYSRQLGGPALSLFQIEPRTFRDLCDYAQRKQLRLVDDLPCSPYRLIFDPRLAAGMARAFFLRFSEPIPPAMDIDGLATYAKHFWNTRYGKATPDDYATAWRTYFEKAPR